MAIEANSILALMHTWAPPTQQLVDCLQQTHINLISETIAALDIGKQKVLDGIFTKDVRQLHSGIRLGTGAAALVICNYNARFVDLVCQHFLS